MALVNTVRWESDPAAEPPARNGFRKSMIGDIVRVQLGSDPPEVWHAIIEAVDDDGRAQLRGLEFFIIKGE